MKRFSKAMISQFHKIAQQRAEDMGTEFLLTKKQFADILKKNCHYCGAEPSLYKNISTLSLHRIRTDISYTVENCLPCCYVCRDMRGSLTDKGFTEKIEQIYKNFNNGDDDATRSIYVTERNAGTRGSAILKHIYDMVEIDNLQKADVKALLNSLVDEHINEVDLLDPEGVND
jgi:hypothetical protein